MFCPSTKIPGNTACACPGKIADEPQSRKASKITQAENDDQEAAFVVGRDILRSRVVWFIHHSLF
jgi:hypothetical protein